MKVSYSVQKYKYHSAYPRDTTHLPTPRKIYQDCQLYVKIWLKIANFDKFTLLLGKGHNLSGRGGAWKIFSAAEKSLTPPRIDQKKFDPPQGSIEKSLTPPKSTRIFIKNLCVLYCE